MRDFPDTTGFLSAGLDPAHSHVWVKVALLRRIAEASCLGIDLILELPQDIQLPADPHPDNGWLSGGRKAPETSQAKVESSNWPAGSLQRRRHVLDLGRLDVAKEP
jgi:hypothetical protein